MMPVFVDGLVALAVVLLLETVVSQFSQISVINAVILLAAFILMCVGVFVVRKLAVRDAGGKLTIPLILLDRRLHIASAILFTLSLVLMLAVQLGYLNNFFKVERLEQGETAPLFMVALLIPFVYIVVLLRKSTPTIEMENGRYPWLATFALLFINLMILVTTFQFATWIQLQGLTGDWFLGVIIFAFLALFFGPPRWIYLSKQPDIGGDLSSLALWAACAWLIMS